MLTDQSPRLGFIGIGAMGRRIAAESDAIFSSLTNDDAVKSVYTGPEGRNT